MSAVNGQPATAQPTAPASPTPTLVGAQLELRGATLAWRSVLRHAAAQLGSLSGRSKADRDCQLAIRDAVGHLNTACALLTLIDTVLDPDAPDPARAHCAADLAHHTRSLTR